MTATIEVPQRLVDDVVLIRRDLHMHPELGFEEHRTATIVADRLRRLGYDVHEGIGKTGVVATIEGRYPGRTIMLRADMDALPVLEETTHAYRSQFDGRMHACGHDGHVAILLGAAALIADRKDEIHGRVCLLFQPAEEGLGGAKAMIEDGVIERFRIERAYGLHLYSKYPTGTLAFKTGALYASSDSIEVTILGVPGHGSAPHQTVDPIYTAATFVTSLQQIVSRNVDPVEPAVISIGAIHGGSIHNQIPRTCSMLGTVRAFNDDVREHMPSRIERVLRACCDASGAQYEYDYIWRYPVTSNDADQTAYARALAQSHFTDEFVVDGVRQMGAEDFSFFAERVPACFFQLGCAGDKGTSFPHHSSYFNIDERALPTGVSMMTAIALDAGKNAP